MHRHPGVHRREPRERVWQQAVQRGVDRADAQFAHGIRLIHPSPQFIHFPQQRYATRRQPSPGLGGCHGTAGPPQQRGAELPLQHLDLLRDRRRRHIEPPRGFCQRAGLHHQRESLQVSGFHRSSNVRT
ncbi:hypothetical protein D3C86_1304610 [compost metagenome]